jgi:hypothetical protein
MMAVATVPKILREKLGEDGAEALVVFMNEAQESAKNGVFQVLEERFARRLAEEIANLRIEFHGAIADLRAELKGEIADSKAELKSEIVNLRAEMHKEKAGTIRWMFLFWITQMAAFLAMMWKFTP